MMMIEQILATEEIIAKKFLIIEQSGLFIQSVFCFAILLQIQNFDYVSYTYPSKLIIK